MYNKEDLLFWTGIMRDHANFQVDTLAPKEHAFIEKSTYFMELFKQFNLEIQNSDSIKKTYPKLLNGLKCFIDYKRGILANQLQCTIAINLPPNNINHQIIEANQFMMLLTTPAPKHMDANMKTMMYTEQLKQWISDTAFHASLLSAVLDPVEEMQIQQAMGFKMNLQKLYIKASEVQIMLMHTGLADGALLQLSNESILMMTEFILFCEKIKELRQACKILAQGTFTPLVPDHFIREQQHWIEKIKENIK